MVFVVGGGGGGPSPLHAPNVAAPDAQWLEPSRCSDDPIGAALASVAPRSLETPPLAGPFVAVNEPSYDRNSTTCPPASTSARPSGPFCSPFVGYDSTTTPRSPHVAGITA